MAWYCTAPQHGPDMARGGGKRVSSGRRDIVGFTDGHTGLLQWTMACSCVQWHTHTAHNKFFYCLFTSSYRFVASLPFLLRPRNKQCKARQTSPRNLYHIALSDRLNALLTGFFPIWRALYGRSPGGATSPSRHDPLPFPIYFERAFSRFVNKQTNTSHQNNTSPAITKSL